MREGKFQKELIKEIEKKFPGSMVLKNDPEYIQGIPDLLVLFKGKWASLECKASETSQHRPNQDFYVDKMHEMSYSAFVYPENKKEVLNELAHHFRV